VGPPSSSFMAETHSRNPGQLPGAADCARGRPRLDQPFSINMARPGGINEVGIRRAFP
jgi:hypothetical protein